MTSTCSNDDQGKLIFLYELSRLRSKERLNFEKHLMNCDFCLQELREMQPLIHALREKKEDILSRLALEGISFDEQKRVLRKLYQAAPAAGRFDGLWEKLRHLIEDLRRPTIWIPVAATVLILILVLPKGRQTNPYLTYLDYTRAPYTHIDFRSPAGQPEEEARQAFDAGIALYLRDNYRLAIPYLQKAVQIAPDESEYWLYLGVSHYLDRKPELAIEALNHARSAADADVKTTAHWYLSQAYLLIGDAAQALPLLQETVRLNGNYASQAESLLVKINPNLK